MAEVKVWSRFIGTKSDGSFVKLRIQDLPNDRVKDAEELHLKYYVSGETLLRTAGIHKNPKALEQFKSEIPEIWKDTEQTICCIDDIDPNPKIIGLSTIFLSEKDHGDCMSDITDEEKATEEMKLFWKILTTMLSLYDVGEYPQYNGYGIVVDPEYRGMGIAQQFLKQRRLACREKNVPVTMAWMTSIGTQKAADRDGWETLYEESFESFGEKCGVKIDTSTPTLKYMVGRPDP